MLLGIGSYAFRWALGTTTFRPDTPARLEDLLREAADLGCAVLQVADNDELEGADRDDLYALRDRAETLNVRWQTGFTGATEDRLERHLAIARALDADVVRVVLNDHSPKSLEIRALQRWAPAFAAAGIKVGLENHFTVSSSRLLEVVEEVGVDTVGVVLDVANSIMCGEWPHETIAALSPYAVCLHLKDYRLVPDPDGVGGHVVGAPLGQGRTDVAAVLDAVRPVDDGGLAVVLEQWAPRRVDIDETLAAERRWRQTSVTTARTWLPEPAGAGS